MQVTDVHVRKISNRNYTKAVATITFDDEFVVHDIKIIEGKKGLFMGMPSVKRSDGDFRDVAHAINTETRNKIQDAIFEAYEQMMLQDEVDAAAALASSNDFVEDEESA